MPDENGPDTVLRSARVKNLGATAKDERLSVDDLKGISADFAAICRRFSEHPILVLPSVFLIESSH